MSSSSFEYQLDEWDQKDGAHTTETVDWIAGQRGVHSIGTLAAEGASVNIDHDWTTVGFGRASPAPPSCSRRPSPSTGARRSRCGSVA